MQSFIKSIGSFLLVAVVLCACGGNANAAGLMIVKDQQAAGTNGGSSISGTQQRVLNTTIINTIAGASLSANQVSLPAGFTYKIYACAPATININRHQAFVRNVTTSTNYYLSNEYVAAVAVSTKSCGTVIVTTTGGEVIELDHWTSSAVAGVGLGIGNSSGAISVFSEMVIEQL